MNTLAATFLCAICSTTAIAGEIVFNDMTRSCDSLEKINVVHPNSEVSVNCANKKVVYVYTENSTIKVSGALTYVVLTPESNNNVINYFGAANSLLLAADFGVNNTLSAMTE